MTAKTWMITGAYLLLMNAIGFIAMGRDKRKAKRHGWRTPEARLFCIAILGGSLGVLLGMLAFRHKSKHAKFVIGIPLILLLQVLAAALLVL